MLTEKEVNEVREYFSVFSPAPSVTLDRGQQSEEESYILIENGGLSIGRHIASGGIDGAHSSPYFLVYNHEGEDDGVSYPHLSSAIEAAMEYYTAELFRRVNDRIVTDAIASAHSTNWRRARRSIHSGKGIL